jgi:ribosomal protein S18 acetylase RimI-like enzyme
MMTTIRPMLEADLDAVRRVDAIAFGAWREQLTGEKEELPPRTRANVLALREKDARGCFVAEQDGRVVGLIFSRTWGSVAWFGTFAVLPDRQRRGIGQRLLAASLHYLRQTPPRVIGLETMPQSPYNLGLYLKHGFRPSLPTLLLGRQLERGTVRQARLQHWSRADAETQRRWLSELREATDHISPGLDYAKEITSTARHGFGETLLLTADTRAIGMSNVWLTGSREGCGHETAYVQIMALDPAHTTADNFHALVDASESLAHAHDKQKIVLPVNTRHAWALDQLLDAGYRLERLSARMILAGTDTAPPTDEYVNLSRWAG